jgi:S-formylglutathione hydrolase FrmB
MYKSVSAFAPIANPINCPWGQKAFKGYFGEDQQQKWKEHDATELVKQWKGPLEILIDVVRIQTARKVCTDRSRAPATTSISKANYSPRT